MSDNYPSSATLSEVDCVTCLLVAVFAGGLPEILNFKVMVEMLGLRLLRDYSFRG